MQQSVREKPKPQAGDLGRMAQHDNNRHHDYNSLFNPRQDPGPMLNPMIQTAAKLGLYGLACDLALLCHSRAFSNEGATDG